MNSETMAIAVVGKPPEVAIELCNKVETIG